jgi:phytanoyl-CoA hydroxylase
MSLQLSAEQIEFFNTNGYLVVPNYLSSELVAGLKGRMKEILGEFDYTSERTIFTTGTDQAAHANDYFLGSSDKIRYFWEEHAWEKSVDESGNITKKLVNPVHESINKVGHALHDLDETFQKVSYDKAIGRIARDLGLVKPLATQSMYIFKQPRIGGDVCAHQDGTYLFTTPQSVIGFWWALDKCTVNNGCLWAVPGSHRMGVLRQYRRTSATTSNADTKMEYYPEEKENFDLTGAVPLEIEAGSLVILHYAVVHYSERNTSNDARHAYSIHVVDGKDGVEYSDRNWLQRPNMPFNEITI